MEGTVTVGEVFSARLREVRRKRKWSQQHLAEELEAIGYALDRSTISRLEGGTGEPSLADLLALSAALGVSPLFLVTPRDETGLRIADGLWIAARTADLWIAGLGHIGYSRPTKRNHEAMTEYVKSHGSGEGQLPWDDAEFDALQGAGQRDVDFWLSEAPPGWNPVRVETLDTYVSRPGDEQS